MFYINFIVFAINTTSRLIICFMSHALNRNNYVNQMSLPGNSPISPQKPGDQEEREDDYSEGNDDLKTGDDLETSDDLETDEDEEINDDQNTRHTCIRYGTKKVYIFQNCADVWQNISHKIVAVLGHYSEVVNHEVQHLPCPNSDTLI